LKCGRKIGRKNTQIFYQKIFLQKAVKNEGYNLKPSNMAFLYP